MGKTEKTANTTMTVTIEKKNRVWCGVVVKRKDKSDLTTRIRKEAVEDRPVGEPFTVYGHIEWTSNGYGTTSELVILNNEEKEKDIQGAIENIMAEIREDAHKGFISDRLVEKLKQYKGYSQYSQEIADLRRKIQTDKWIGYFRKHIAEGWYYERALTELHKLNCHDYDEEIRQGKLACEKKKREAREKKQEEEREAGIVSLSIPAYHGWNGRPQKGDILEHRERYYRVISSYYYDSDGWSFGAMNDEWYAVKAQDITETPEGQERVQAREKTRQKKARIAAAKNAVATLGAAIWKNGHYYEAADGMWTSDIPGILLYDDFNIYGGGYQIRQAGETLFYVNNNGADGDDWSVNNIRTGGAGAYAFQTELANVKEEYNVMMEAVREAAEEKKDLMNTGFQEEAWTLASASGQGTANHDE